MMKKCAHKGAKENVPAKASDIKHMKTDPSLAKKELKWDSAYSFEDGMKETVEFFS